MHDFENACFASNKICKFLYYFGRKKHIRYDHNICVESIESTEMLISAMYETTSEKNISIPLKRGLKCATNIINT